MVREGQQLMGIRPQEVQLQDGGGGCSEMLMLNVLESVEQAERKTRAGGAAVIIEWKEGCKTERERWAGDGGGSVEFVEWKEGCKTGVPGGYDASPLLRGTSTAGDLQIFPHQIPPFEQQGSLDLLIAHAEVEQDVMALAAGEVVVRRKDGDQGQALIV
ncbi:MAG: hypothetical protein FRX49_09842 [Trebouxia sp. A1-2]|nr:MAG: hypothetical protein FRX49_09842 [Trebouxia sp. A1-2]